MQIYGKIYTQEIIDLINEAIEKKPEISRLELSRMVCETMNWRSANGNLQDMSCRKALAELNRRGVIKLPEIKQKYSFEKRSEKRVEVQINEITCKLSELGIITVEPITSRYSKDSKIWRSLLDQYHYLGSGHLCGAQIRYIVKSSIYGYIGALSFSSGGWKLKARDEYIGWSESAKNDNIKYVLNNARFLILPTIKVKNLASYVLSRVLSRLPKDWEQRYSVSPVLVETYIDPERFTGTSYISGNWKYVGKSSGRRDGIRKQIYLYHLSKSWKTILCKEKPYRLGERPSPGKGSDWTEEEFGRVNFYDNRLKERLKTIAGDFFNSPQSNIPEACGDKAAAIGAYRFFKNENVKMEVILTAHKEATIERIREHKVVLAPQDTTILDYSTHPKTEGLGPINTIKAQNIGLILHDTLAFSEQGTPLGVLDAQCWARDQEEQGKSKRRKELPIEEKESMKWINSLKKVNEVRQLCPETMIVSIGDRESDIYELFKAAQAIPEGPKLLVRSERSRNRKTDHEDLWEYMSKREIAGSLEIHLPRRGNKKGRDARVELRFSEVNLMPPKRFKEDESIQAWAVYLKEEVGSSSTESPIEWMLLTTAAVEKFEDAVKRVEWYTGRWGIEVYHRILKSGCRIKDRQLSTTDSLEASLGIDMVVAWRIYYMTMLGRERPDFPCTEFFRDVQWKALHCYYNKTKNYPSKPPTLKEAIRMVGAIGGHLGRKGDGMPGAQALWRGIIRLDTATEMFVILTAKPPPV